jgi:UDP-glucose 4-epimerase
MNLGLPETITDQGIFDEIAKNIGFTGKPIYAPHRTGEIYKTALSAKKALAVLGWKPTITFAKGIKRHIRETGNA